MQRGRELTLQGNHGSIVSRAYHRLNMPRARQHNTDAHLAPRILRILHTLRSATLSLQELRMHQKDICPSTIPQCKLSRAARGMVSLVGRIGPPKSVHDGVNTGWFLGRSAMPWTTRGKVKLVGRIAPHTCLRRSTYGTLASCFAAHLFHTRLD